MLQKIVKVGDKEVAFRSSATIPRLYRMKFKRDIFKDLSKLEQSYQGKTSKGGAFEIEDLEIFENVAYIMAFHADHSIPDNIDDWLDQFEMFSIYEVLPEILELWGTNLITDSSREMTTPLFLLRCTEIGISIRDLDLLTIGLVMDMWTEKGNDSAKYSTTITAGQEEFDRF